MEHPTGTAKRHGNRSQTEFRRVHYEESDSNICAACRLSLRTEKGEKMKKILIALIVLLLLLSFSARAEDTADFFESQLEASGAGEIMEQMPAETQSLMESLGLANMDYQQLLDVSPGRILTMLLDIVTGKVASPLKAITAIAGIILLCALLHTFKDSFSGKTMDTVFNLISALLIGVLIIIPVMQCVSYACSAVKLSSDVMLVFIPVLAGLMAASGNFMAAKSYNMLVFAVAEVMSRFSSSVLTGLVGIFMAFCIITSLSPSLNLGGTVKVIKNTVTIVLGFASTLFVGLLTLQGLVGGAADTVTHKTAKYLIGNFVPVVGSALSDSLSSIQSCVGLVKNTVGAFGMIGLSLIYIPVIFEILIWMLTLHLCAACSELFELSNISNVLKGIASALSLLLAILLFCGLLLIVSTAIMLMMGGVKGG